MKHQSLLEVPGSEIRVLECGSVGVRSVAVDSNLYCDHAVKIEFPPAGQPGHRRTDDPWSTQGRLSQKMLEGTFKNTTIDFIVVYNLIYIWPIENVFCTAIEMKKKGKEMVRLQ